MRLRNWLLTGTSIAVLALAPATTARAQSAELLTAYQAYAAAQAGGDQGQGAQHVAHLARSEEGQGDAEEGGGDRPRGRAALRRGRRRDDLARGVPGEERLHALEIGLRDESRLALGEVGAWLHDRGALNVRVRAARSFSSSASEAANGVPAALAISARRHSKATPATTKNRITPTIAAKR